MLTKFGMVWNKYKNVGNIFMFIRLILPVNEIGCVDHFSKVTLVHSKRVAKLSLKRSEILSYNYTQVCEIMSSHLKKISIKRE